jgi:hypothetical protein
MADVISRPTFYEGQYVGAEDLNAVVRQAAGWQGRHGRELHSWGIAAGLTLSGTPRKTAANASFVDVTLSGGMAVDGYGYEIVVAGDTVISPADFDVASVASDDLTASYPVYLVGIDRQLAAAATGGSCASTQSSRTVESFQIEFDAPGRQSDVEQQQRPGGFAAGPGTGAARPAWKILLGYVQWDPGLRKFTKVSMDPQEGVARRYVGVRAAEVIAPAGEVIVRTDERDVAQKTVLVVSSAGNDAVVIGRQDGAGGVTKLLTVSRSGDVTAAGVISGAVTVGTHVQSGIAADGALLPLPTGVDPANLASGVATLHVQVTPRLSFKSAPVEYGSNKIPMVEHCHVDDDLRVRCQIRWLDPTGPTHEIKPGVVDYLVLVSVQEKAS